MFTRNPTQRNMPDTMPNAPGPAAAPPPAPSDGNTAPLMENTKPSSAPHGQSMDHSVIGNDLTIVGSGLKIFSRGVLQVDGEVQGDVVGSKIIIGPTGKVTGLVNAEEIVVHGAIFGTIKAADVRLAPSAVVEGDLYHQSFALDQGASFEGRSRRAGSREELVPDIEQMI